MPSRWTPKKRRAQRGLTLIEVGVSIVLATLILAAVMYLVADSSEKRKAHQEGEYLAHISHAAAAYVRSYENLLKSQTSLTPLKIDLTGAGIIVTDAHGNTHYLPSLKGAGLLPSGFENNSRFRQNYALWVRKDASNNVFGLITGDKNSRKLSDETIKSIILSAGAAGGFWPQTPPMGGTADTVVSGVAAWQLKQSDWGDPSITHGHPLGYTLFSQSAIAFGQNGDPTSPNPTSNLNHYLARTRAALTCTGCSNNNKMQTDLFMGPPASYGFNLKNANLFDVRGELYSDTLGYALTGTSTPFLIDADTYIPHDILAAADINFKKAWIHQINAQNTIISGGVAAGIQVSANIVNPERLTSRDRTSVFLKNFNGQSINTVESSFSKGGITLRDLAAPNQDSIIILQTSFQEGRTLPVDGILTQTGAGVFLAFNSSAVSPYQSIDIPNGIEFSDGAPTPFSTARPFGTLKGIVDVNPSSTTTINVNGSTATFVGRDTHNISSITSNDGAPGAPAEALSATIPNFYFSGSFVMDATNATGTNYFSAQVVMDDLYGLNTSTINAYNLTITNISTSSDRRLKKAIRPLKKSLQNINSLKPYRFRWKETGKQDVGLIAQDVRDVYPSLVIKDQSGFLSVNYTALIAPVINALKELDHWILNLTQRIEKLNKDTESVGDKIQKQHATLEHLYAIGQKKLQKLNPHKTSTSLMP